MPPSPSEQKPANEPVGPLVGAVIVVGLLIIGGIYFWSQRIEKLHIQNPLPLLTGETSSTDSTSSPQATITP